MNKIKEIIRKSMSELRENLPLEYQDSCAITIYENLQKLEEYRYAKKLGLYMTSKGEVDLSKIWNTASLHGKQCYFPAINPDKTISFLPATPKSKFKENKYGILEPDVESKLAKPTDELDIILVPLVAFDGYGTRIGHGLGYYDRTLQNCHRPLVIGIAYEFQRQPFIEAEPWDIKIPLIITETGLYWSKA